MSTAASESPLDPTDIINRATSLGKHAGFKIETFATIVGTPLIALTRPALPGRPHFYLSAGIHGDEPAPSHALLRLLESDIFDDRAGWSLVPMLNPTGFRLGTRENADGVDLNRDYLEGCSIEIGGHLRWLRNQPAFRSIFCLHEDWESTGFYLYELNPGHHPSPTAPMLAAAARYMPLDQSSVIDGRPTAAPGLILPHHDPATRSVGAEAVYLCQHHTPLSYTLETPSSLPLELRIQTLCTTVQTGLDKLISLQY